MENGLSSVLDAHIAAAAAEVEGRVGLFSERSVAGLERRGSLPTEKLSLAIVVWPIDCEMLSALRDQWAARVLVYVDIEADAQALLELGFTPVEEVGLFRLYEFDIAHYKKTPDWLNSKGWANPRNWDKYRW